MRRIALGALFLAGVPWLLTAGAVAQVPPQLPPPATQTPPPPPAGGQDPVGGRGAAPAGRGEAGPGRAGAPGGRGGVSLELNRMEHGPFVSSTVATDPVTEKGIAVRVGGPAQGVMMFDTDLLRVSAAWTGGFLTWYAARDGLQTWPTPEGAIHFTTGKGPGWSRSGSFADPRPIPLGPLPRAIGRYQGLYLNGDHVVFSYTVGATQIYESPGYAAVANRPVMTRTFNLPATADALQLRVLELPDEPVLQKEAAFIRLRRFGRFDTRLVGFRGLPAGAKWSVVDRQLTLQLPALPQPLRFELAVGPLLSGNMAAVNVFATALTEHLAGPSPVVDLTAWRQPGTARWQPVETQALTGSDAGPFAVDTFTIPDPNPWNSWIRLGGMDFLSDGRAVVCSISGDVWLVSGIGPTTGTLRWKRFATGLNQPLGVKVVRDRIYVTGRDQITILNDRNNDGEADFYENFNNELLASDNFHEFTMHLETDSKGNFYLAKGTDWPAVNNEGIAALHSPHNGTLLRLSPDGGKLEIAATGLRHPNGLGLGPNDEIAVADNQGNWLPTSVLHMIRPGAVYGFVPSIQAPEVPKDFEKPIVWLPHAVDNSPGSPIWITSKQWGPLAGKMLLTSYGKATLSLVMTERVDGQIQGGFLNLPLRFDSGLMRGRFREDGHLYLAGLSNWQSDGSKKGGFHRVRYTGKPLHLPLDLNVKPNGIQLRFSEPLDAASAGDPQNYDVQQANYRWHSMYGSPQFLVSDPARQGRDPVEIRSIRVSEDRRTVFLEIADLKPVMQMQIGYILKAADGAELRQTIHSTINRVPGAPPR